MNLQKWEYKVVCRPLHADYSYVENILNQMGNEGWELVAVTPEGGYTLKRPVINISVNTENLNKNTNSIAEIIALYQ